MIRGVERLALVFLVDLIGRRRGSGGCDAWPAGDVDAWHADAEVGTGVTAGVVGVGASEHRRAGHASYIAAVRQAIEARDAQGWDGAVAPFLVHPRMSGNAAVARVDTRDDTKAPFVDGGPTGCSIAIASADPDTDPPTSKALPVRRSSTDDPFPVYQSTKWPASCRNSNGCPELDWVNLIKRAVPSGQTVRVFRSPEPQARYSGDPAR